MIGAGCLSVQRFRKGLLVAFAVRLCCLGLRLLLLVGLLHQVLLILLRVLVLVIVVRMRIGLGEAFRRWREGREANEGSERQETDASRFHGLTSESDLAESYTLAAGLCSFFAQKFLRGAASRRDVVPGLFPRVRHTVSSEGIFPNLNKFPIDTCQTAHISFSGHPIAQFKSLERS